MTYGAKKAKNPLIRQKILKKLYENTVYCNELKKP